MSAPTRQSTAQSVLLGATSFFVSSASSLSRVVWGSELGSVPEQLIDSPAPAAGARAGAPTRCAGTRKGSAPGEAGGGPFCGGIDRLGLDGAVLALLALDHHRVAGMDLTCPGLRRASHLGGAAGQDLEGVALGIGDVERAAVDCRDRSRGPTPEGRRQSAPGVPAGAKSRQPSGAEWIGARVAATVLLNQDPGDEARRGDQQTQQPD